jgi:hypothetical protein
MTWNGRPFDANRFARDLKDKAIAKAIEVMIQRGRAAATSLVDPETGLHPLTFAWKAPPASVRITTSGSETFAIELEKRLDKERRRDRDGSDVQPLVYFAHASEDKATARPIAKHLLENGIDVWFDQWEITAGDSLRRKMDAGLGACTHFVVLLSPTAIKKPWVNEEIDAGFVMRVEGSAKFIPLRLGLPLTDLPPLLKGMLSPEIASDNQPALNALVDQIHGVSAKPALGPKPRYVQRVGELAHFSPAAITIGKHMASVSASGTLFDPQLDFEDLGAATGLSHGDVELGVLDLVEAGLLEEGGGIGEDIVWPLGPLFITFDPHVHDWRPAEDARTLAATMVNQGADQYSPRDLIDVVGWSPRRMNAALHAVKAAGLASCESFMDGENWAVSHLMVTPQTRRAARG